MDETIIEIIAGVITLAIIVFLISRKFTSMDKDLAKVQEELKELKKDFKKLYEAFHDKLHS